MTGRGGREQRGSTLIVILIFAILIAGFASTGVWRTVQETQAGTGRRIHARAEVEAISLLAEAELDLEMGLADPDGANQRLAEVLSTGTVRALADDTDAVNEISGTDYRLLLANGRGRVWATRLAGDYVRLESEATIGMETAYLSRTYLERTPACAFQRFVAAVGAFPATANLMLGLQPFKGGDVLNVSPAPSALTAAGGAARRAGIPDLPALAAPADQIALAAYEVPMPGDGVFAEMKALADAACVFAPVEGYVVELLGSSISVTPVLAGGVLGPPSVLGLPAGGILYVMDDILSLEGTLNGRLTVVSEGTIHVTDSLRYVDDDGDFAMTGGSLSDSTFASNPDYDGDSALGIVARGNVFYAPAMPSSVEIDAAMYSHTGTIGLQMLWYHSTLGLNESGFGAPIYFDPYTIKGKASVKELGAKASAGMPSTAVQGTTLGFTLGVSLYDPQLQERPPPGFPRFRLQAATVTRRVGGVEGLRAGGSRSVTRTTTDLEPVPADPARFAAVQEAVRLNGRLFGVKLED